MARKASTSPDISHDEALVAELRADPAFATAYLKAALAESEDPQVLLIALRQVASAHGMAEVAGRARIERESMYRALSSKGNPRFSTIVAILGALGLTLSVEPTHTRVRVRATGGKTAKRGTSSKSAAKSTKGRAA
jgi:probable addiction module antidote protein